MATRTWDGGGGDALASTANNWDTNVAPVAADIVVFDATSSKNCTWDITADLASINTTGYAGVVTLSVTLRVSGNITFANSTFANGSQKVIMESTSTIDVGTVGNDFNDVDFNSSGTRTLSNNITINGNMAINGGNIGINNNKIFLSGNFTLVTGETSGVSTLEFTGSGTQVWSHPGGGRISNSIIINKSGGSVTLSGAISWGPSGGSFIHTVGTVTTTGSTFTVFGAATWDTSGMSFNNMTFAATGHILTSDLNVNGTLDLATTSNVSFDINTINLKGDLKNTIAGGFAVAFAGTAVLEFNGTGAQDWSNAAGGIKMNIPVKINKPSGTLTFTGTITHGEGNPSQSIFTYVTGTVDAGTSTMEFGSAVSSSGMTFNNVKFRKNTDIDNNMTINGNLVTSETITVNGSKILLSGNYTQTAGRFSGNATLEWTGAGTQTWGLTPGGEDIRLNIIINKSGGSLIFPSGTIKWGSNGKSFTHTAGTVTVTGNTFIVNEQNTLDTSGMSFNNLTFDDNGDQTLTSDLNVNGDMDLTHTGSTRFGGASPTINLKGDLKSTGSGSWGIDAFDGSLPTIEFNGTGAQDWSNAGGGTNMNIKVRINKASGTLTLTGTLSHGTGNSQTTFTYTTGTVNAGTSTMKFGSAIASNGMIFNNVEFRVTASLTNNMDVDGNLVISGGTFSPGSNTLNVEGNWSLTGGSMTPGTSTVVLDGATSQTLVGSTTFGGLTLTAGRTYNFTAGTTQTVSGLLSSPGTSGSNITLASVTPGSTWTLKLTGTQNIDFTNPTDSICDFTGATGRAINGTLSNCTNWNRGNMAMVVT